MANIQERKPTFAGTIQTDGYQKMIASTIQDPGKRDRFQAGIISAVAVNPELQKCDPRTVLAAAFVGENLGLSPSPQLGHYYMVPYSNKATFQIGYKGLIQMAIKSGMYKHIAASPIKQGELVGHNPITDEVTLKPIEDHAAREAAKTIGYYARIKLVNGFEKEIYWTKEKAEAHGRRYSKAYGKFWVPHFDAMAMKTVLRRLLGTWGVLSNEMTIAFEKEPGNDIADYDGEMPEIEFVNGNDMGDIPEALPEPKQDEDSEAPPLPAMPAQGGVEDISFDDL